MTLDGYKVLKDAGIEQFAYPGHPLVLAYVVMLVFGSHAEAVAPAAHGWSAALGDSRVPGAGDHVAAAMDVLGIGARGGSPDDMIAAAHAYWDAGRAGGHVKNVDQGRMEALILESAFRDRCSVWDFSLQSVLSAPV